VSSPANPACSSCAKSAAASQQVLQRRSRALVAKAPLLGFALRRSLSSVSGIAPNSKFNLRLDWEMRSGGAPPLIDRANVLFGSYSIEERAGVRSRWFPPEIEVLSVFNHPVYEAHPQPGATN